jgi:RNA polymerase sigma-70 factor
MGALASAFLARAGIRVDQPADLERLEHLLQRFWEVSRSRWPDVPLSSDAFVRHLAAVLPEPAPGEDLEHVLAQVVPGDLYLAGACAEGIPAAHTAFERHHLAGVPSTLAHMRLPAAVVDEICQQVREKLLLRTEAPPKIAEYSGRGTLTNWVRVVVLRTAISLLRAKSEVVEESEAILAALPTPASDPELEAIKRRYQDELRQSLEDAFAALPSERRYLLRLHFVDRLSTTEIGTLLNVNQSTASRRIQGVRQEVYEETRRLLKERLGLSSQEFTSVLRAVESDLDLSISRILAVA